MSDSYVILGMFTYESDLGERFSQLSKSQLDCVLDDMVRMTWARKPGGITIAPDTRRYSWDEVGARGTGAHSNGDYGLLWETNKVGVLGRV